MSEATEMIALQSSAMILVEATVVAGMTGQHTVRTLVRVQLNPVVDSTTLGWELTHGTRTERLNYVGTTDEETLQGVMRGTAELLPPHLVLVAKPLVVHQLLHVEITATRTDLDVMTDASTAGKL